MVEVACNLHVKRWNFDSRNIPDGGKATNTNARIGKWRQVWGRPVKLGGAVSLLLRKVRGRNGSRTTRTMFLSSFMRLSFTHPTCTDHVLSLGATLCSEH